VPDQHDVGESVHVDHPDHILDVRLQPDER
jgi:hypothetical protein